MLTNNIKFKNFSIKSKNSHIKKIFKNLKIDYLNNKVKSLLSLSKNYKYSYSKKLVNKYKSFFHFRVIGMGGSILGAKAIFQFLNHKIKKNFFFIDNLQNRLDSKKNNKSFVNLVISKSGNTLETISNVNILIKKNNKNIFIIENKNNYLNNLANQIKAEVVEHKNYIGGR